MNERVEKTRRQKKEKSTIHPELSTFPPAEGISESPATAKAKSSSSAQQQPHQRETFTLFGASFYKRGYSRQSMANTSFVTANESVQPTNESITATATAASYFVDSSDEDTDEGSNFDDSLAASSRTASSDMATTPTEISFNVHPEEPTMASETSSSASKLAALSTATTLPPPPASRTLAPRRDSVPVAVVAEEAEEDEAASSEARFDVAQNVYGTAKDIWAWGRTVPVVTNLLGLTEAVAAKVLDAAVHMDLPAIDREAVTPQLKRLDDVVVTPVILAVWKLIEPAIAKGDEMVVRPILTEVVPRILAPLGMFGDDNEKELEKEGKMIEEK